MRNMQSWKGTLCCAEAAFALLNTNDLHTEEDKDTMLYIQEEKTLMFISHEFHIVKKMYKIMP